MHNACLAQVWLYLGCLFCCLATEENTMASQSVAGQEVGGVSEGTGGVGVGSRNAPNMCNHTYTHA